jgi:hypothetical protein
MSLSMAEASPIVGYHSLSAIVIPLSQDASDPQLASAVGLHDEGPVFSRRSQNRFFSDSLFQIFNCSTTSLGLRFHGHITALARESCKRSSTHGKLTNETTIVGA